MIQNLSLFIFLFSYLNFFHKELRYFWISWAEFSIVVGRGSRYGEGKFLQWRMPENKRFDITSLAVATDNTSHGQFEFAELMGKVDLQ